jgi:hypothetical protein
VRKQIADMASDLKESLMMIANKNVTEYEALKCMSTGDFLIKYKLFIDEIEAKQRANER